MLNVFICEDNLPHKNQIEKCVENCITIHNLDMEITLSTHDPEAVIEYIKRNPVPGLYFLDVNLNHNINGVMLANTIREYDPRGFIVFITTHDEALPLTFQYKVEALDFILKDEFFEIRSKINDCILSAHKRYAAKSNELKNNFSFKAFDKYVTIEHSNILLFETSTDSAHKVKLHTLNGIYEFYGALNKLSDDLNDNFYRCHHSFIVNLAQELRFEIRQKTIYFSNGDSCPVSSRKIRELARILNNSGRH